MSQGVMHLKNYVKKSFNNHGEYKLQTSNFDEKTIVQQEKYFPIKETKTLPTFNDKTNVSRP